MKSKLFKILGVVAVVAMLASTLVALPASAISGVSVSVTSATNKINNVGNYSVYATLGTQLTGTTTGTITLPYTTDAATFTSVAATDKVALTVTAGAATITGPATLASGVYSFSAGAQVETIAATAPGTVITYTKTVGNATLATTVDLSLPAPSCTAAPGAFLLTAVGDTMVFTAAAATDVVTLTFGTGAASSVVFSPVGTATYVGGVITFSAIGQTATVTGTVVGTAGTWARTAGLATGALGTNIYPTAVSATSTANGDTITMTFPTGYTLSAITGTFASSSGWVTLPGASSPTFVPSVLTIGTSTNGQTFWNFSTSAMTVTLTLGAGDYIGAQAQILLNITAGITNPGTAGSYTVNFATSKETTAVTSNAIVISNPVIPPVAGIASVFNSAAVAMTQYNDLALAIGYVNANALSGAVIKLSAGTYNTAFPGSTLPITIQGTDANAVNVIIKSTAGWTLSGKTVLLDMLTLDNSSGALILADTGTGATGTISNSYIKGGVVTLSGVKDTLSADTITVANGAVGVNVTGGTAAAVTGSTFTIAGTGFGMTVAVNTTITGSTFNGAAGPAGVTATGLGVTVSAGTANSIKTSAFSGLATALTVTSGTVTFDGNTVDSCGYGSAPTTDTISVTGTSGLNVINNKITNSKNYIINVTANDNLVLVNFNQFSGNAKAALTAGNVLTTGLNVTHNYWGGAAAPANVTTVGSVVNYSNPLAVAPGASGIAAATALNATATAGVNIVNIAGATEVGATALASNPVTPTLPSTVTVKQYYDVFGIGATGAVDIFFYGTTANPVTSSFTVYFYNTINGTWTVAPGVSVNVFANSVEVNYTASATTSPSLAQLGALPWALVVINPTAPGAPTIGTPGVAVTGIGISNASFSWTPTGATASATYNFVLSTSSTFAAAGNVFTASPTTNGVVVAKTLAYNTTYYWEVQAVDSTGALKSAFTTSFFTTALQATPVLTPALGEQGVSLTPTFTWSAVPGAVSYEFALAQEIGAVNKFDILDYSNNTVTNGITAQETLLYSTTYNWEYRSVDSTGAKSAWTVSFFTTMDKPAVVTTTSSTAVVTTQPTIIITQPTFTQTPITIISTTGTPASPAIPSYLLWAVIAVGAVLVIAVIVLIVRTRRIP